MNDADEGHDGDVAELSAECLVGGHDSLALVVNDSVEGPPVEDAERTHIVKGCCGVLDGAGDVLLRVCGGDLAAADSGGGVVHLAVLLVLYGVRRAAADDGDALARVRDGVGDGCAVVVAGVGKDDCGDAVEAYVGRSLWLDLLPVLVVEHVGALGVLDVVAAEVGDVEDSLALGGDAVDVAEDIAVVGLVHHDVHVEVAGRAVPAQHAVHVVRQEDAADALAAVEQDGAHALHCRVEHGRHELVVLDAQVRGYGHLRHHLALTDVDLLDAPEGRAQLQPALPQPVVVLLPVVHLGAAGEHRLDVRARRPQRLVQLAGTLHLDRRVVLPDRLGVCLHCALHHHCKVVLRVVDHRCVERRVVVREEQRLVEPDVLQHVQPGAVLAQRRLESSLQVCDAWHQRAAEPDVVELPLQRPGFHDLRNPCASLRVHHADNLCLQDGCDLFFTITASTLLADKAHLGLLGRGRCCLGCCCSCGREAADGRGHAAARAEQDGRSVLGGRLEPVAALLPGVGGRGDVAEGVVCGVVGREGGPGDGDVPLVERAEGLDERGELEVAGRGAQHGGHLGAVAGQALLCSDLAHVVREHRVGRKLDKHLAGAVVDGVCHGLVEVHGVAHLRAPVLCVELRALGHTLACERRVHRNAVAWVGRREHSRHPCHALRELLGERLHLRRVEGVVHRQELHKRLGVGPRDGGGSGLEGLGSTAHRA